jgi:hypothetical protein
MRPNGAAQNTTKQHKSEGKQKCPFVKVKVIEGVFSGGRNCPPGREPFDSHQRNTLWACISCDKAATSREHLTPALPVVA